MVLLCFAACLWVGTASAEPIAESGSARVALLEVYSSEGCSSCPPAEEWVSRLTGDPGLWKRFVPAVFHVDYWDYIGWKDGFASAVFTTRQRNYADLWNASSVYTPGFVLDGREWKGAGGKIETASPGLAGKLSIERLKGNAYRMVFVPEGANILVSGYAGHAALLGMGIVSKVKAGENAGRRLVHDFTVLDFTEKNMDVNSGSFEMDFELESPAGTETSKLAVVAWVSNESRPEPVQAAGAFLNAAGDLQSLPPETAT